MEQILKDRLELSVDENFYKILGCTQLSSVEQIQTEYKKRVLASHPDKNPDDSDAQVRFKLLQVAKDTLVDSQLRSKYDSWLNSGLNVTWKDWLHHTNSHQMVFHWSIRKPGAMLTEKETLDEMKVPSKHEHYSKFWMTNQQPSKEILEKFRKYQI